MRSWSYGLCHHHYTWGFINSGSAYFSSATYKTIPALPNNLLVFPCACPALQRGTDCSCPSQAQRETLDTIKLFIYFPAPRRSSLLFSGLYSLPTCPWNTQTVNPTRVLSAHCLCGVCETILTSLQLTMAFHERDRDSVKIIIQSWRSSKEISKALHGVGVYQFPPAVHGWCFPQLKKAPHRPSGTSATPHHLLRAQICSPPPHFSFLSHSTSYIMQLQCLHPTSCSVSGLFFSIKDVSAPSCSQKSWPVLTTDLLPLDGQKKEQAELGLWDELLDLCCFHPDSKEE